MNNFDMVISLVPHNIMPTEWNIFFYCKCFGYGFCERDGKRFLSEGPKIGKELVQLSFGTTVNNFFIKVYNFYKEIYLLPRDR
jgi:hypothetical protein